MSTPTKTPNQQYSTPAHEVEIHDAITLYANPVPENEKVITLIRPPIIFSKNSYSTPLALPIGLAYLAAVLEKSKYSVKILDCAGLDVENVQRTEDNAFNVVGMDVDESIKLIDPKTDILGITIMFSQEWPFIKRYIEKVRSKFPEVTIIVGGEHATAMPEYSLRDCLAINYIVMGEGELTLLELVHRLRAGQAIDGMRGVAFLKDDQYQSPGTTPRSADIKEMPWPAWHLIDLEPYFKPNFTMGLATGRNIAMLATRGCPYQCTFCSSPTMWTTRYSMRSVKDVVEEIEFYIKEYQITAVDFYDLTAVVKKDWILELVSEIKSKKLNILWQLPSGTRSEALNHEVLEGLATTGCHFIVYAPESGSQRTLDMIKKRVKLDRMFESIKTALELNMIVKVNFIIGFPFETRRDVYKTLLTTWKLALIKVNDCNISTFAPYPGSELFHELKKEGYFGEINDDYFEGLITQFDLTVPHSYCKNINGWEIMFYRIIGMGIFYILSYLRCPSRLVRLIKMFTKSGAYQAHSLFEQRVLDLKAINKRKTSRLKQNV